jgi:hypothetical protein
VIPKDFMHFMHISCAKSGIDKLLRCTMLISGCCFAVTFRTGNSSPLMPSGIGCGALLPLACCSHSIRYALPGITNVPLKPSEFLAGLFLLGSNI